MSHTFQQTEKASISSVKTSRLEASKVSNSFISLNITVLLDGIDVCKLDLECIGACQGVAVGGKGGWNCRKSVL